MWLSMLYDCLNPLLRYFRIQKNSYLLNRKSRNKLKARVSTCGISIGIVVHVSLTFTTGRSLLLLLSALPRCYCCTNTTTKSFNAIALKLCPFSNKSFRFVSILVSCVRVFFTFFLLNSLLHFSVYDKRPRSLLYNSCSCSCCCC